MKKITNSIKILATLYLSICHGLRAQTQVTIFPDSTIAPVNFNLKPGVFYVPKTAAAASDFTANGIQQNCIRTNVIESALNNSSNLSGCLSLLSSVQGNLQSLSSKCSKLIFIFEKMPAWLSSSSNSAPASTPGWYVLNTKPPANWSTWQAVVDSISSKIINQFGITNAYFEIWNEPDIGSWTGTMNEYFTLYKRTYAGIKSASPLAKVGGPTVNFWANNIYWKPAYGYISNAKADSSLIGQLLDSAVVWNKVPNFISWHNFNLSYQEFSNATNYINQKLASLSLSNIPLIVSEWNAPSQVRDTRLALSFMIKAQLAISKTNINNNAIAAWQDFTSSATEFHADYGLLSYGSIHKPAYNAVLLSEKLKGIQCKMNSSSLFDGISTIQNDTLYMLLSNYCPLPFLEAFNSTLYQGHFNANQLDSAGYIDISGNNVTHLDSIYRGLISIPGSNPMQISINNSIGLYQHYNSIYTTPRQFNLNISGHTGNYSGKMFIIDSTHNNLKFKYDSLLAASYTQTSAIAAILPSQSLNSTTVSLNSGQITFTMQANSVRLFKIHIPGVSGLNETSINKNSFNIYPNPSHDKIYLSFENDVNRTNYLNIFSAMGTLVKTIETNEPALSIDISDLSNGMYFVRSLVTPRLSAKFIKH